MWWVTGAVANSVIATAYFMIVWAIVHPLVQSRQLRTNPLGAATAAIFFSCAVHHGGHVVHMLLPVLGSDPQGLSMRAAYSWEMAAWDVLSALVGVYYWTLRRTYGSLMQGAQLFEDMRTRERQALELNDDVLQGMVVARMAMDIDDRDRSRAALDGAISAASQLISDLLGPAEESESSRLLRRQAATLRTEQ